jgi:hypothetical protein
LQLKKILDRKEYYLMLPEGQATKSANLEPQRTQRTQRTRRGTSVIAANLIRPLSRGGLKWMHQYEVRFLWFPFAALAFLAVQDVIDFVGVYRE